MIRVTVELFPFGDESKKKTLSQFDIANDGTGNGYNASYKARMSPTSDWIEKVVVDYPRLDYNVNNLVYEVLKQFKNTKE